MGQGSGVAMSCSIGHGPSLDMALLWLWHRLAATAQIRLLAWELPCAVGAPQKKKKKKKKSTINSNTSGFISYIQKFLLYLTLKMEENVPYNK